MLCVIVSFRVFGSDHSKCILTMFMLDFTEEPEVRNMKIYFHHYRDFRILTHTTTTLCQVVFASM